MRIPLIILVILAISSIASADDEVWNTHDQCWLTDTTISNVNVTLDCDIYCQGVVNFYNVTFTPLNNYIINPLNDGDVINFDSVYLEPTLYNIEIGTGTGFTNIYNSNLENEYSSSLYNYSENSTLMLVGLQLDNGNYTENPNTVVSGCFLDPTWENGGTRCVNNVTAINIGLISSNSIINTTGLFVAYGGN